MKLVEVIIMRIYVLFCSEKVNELCLEIVFYRENEVFLEKRLIDLERELVFVWNEMGYGLLEFLEFKERKEFLEKKIVEVNCVIDWLK